MRYEIYNGSYVGTAEWTGPGHVELDVADDDRRRWLEGYFAAEDSFLAGSVGGPEMTTERADSSREAFTRAAMRLAAHEYRVRVTNGQPRPAPAGARP